MKFRGFRSFSKTRQVIVASLSSSMVHNKVMSEPWKRFLTLYSVQFLQLLDFISITPVGALFVSERKISSDAISFGLGAYSSTAIIASIVLARIQMNKPKKVLIGLLLVFGTSQLIFFWKVTTTTFIAVRMLGGVTGGIMGAISYSQLGNIENTNHGTWNGRIQTAQSLVTLIGIPVCLLTINYLGSRSYFIGMMCLTALAIAQVLSSSFLRPLHHPNARDAITNKSIWKHFDVVFTGFICYFAAFLFISHLPDYLLNGLHVSPTQLSMGYSLSGVSTLFISGMIGKLGDRYQAKTLLFLFSCALIVSQLLFKLPASVSLMVFVFLPIYLILSTGRAIHQRGIILHKKNEDVVFLHLINNIAIRSGILLSGFTLGVIASVRSDVSYLFNLANLGSILCSLLVIGWVVLERMKSTFRCQ